ncbi:hypothetical protein BD779DRAFT_1447632 [Infundibulicybe gibba]|nr:hypothetical protein BD779DRAFT_1447632 [Infundibulicybe gibba]
MALNIAGRVWTYSLRGIIYHGTDHFTARVITSSGAVWYHDGMLTGANLREEGHISACQDLMTCHSRMAIITVYIQN